MTALPLVPTLVVFIVGCIAAVTDVWKYKVHNVVTFPLFFSGLFYHTFVDGWSGLGFSLSGAFFGFVTLILFYVLGAVGAGDVKFMSGVGAWLGLITTSQVFLITGVAVGLYSLLLIAFRHGIQGVSMHLFVGWCQLRNLAWHFGTEERVEELARRDDRRTRLIPFAAMLTIGICVVVVCQNVFNTSVIALLLGS